jgi:iron-sulfur cluster assembly protein
MACQKTGRFDNFDPNCEPKTRKIDFPRMLIPISITEKAEAEIKHIMANKNIPSDYFLRVGVKGGGCGGMSYALGFDKPKPEDQQFEVDGIRVLIEKKHFMFLMGMQIDFFEGDEARGFTFVNPDLPKRHDI